MPSQGDLGRSLLIKAENTKLFTGFGSDGDKFDLGDVELTLGKTRLNWATISMVSMNGNGFDPVAVGSQGKPIRILVAATGLMQNTGMTLEHLPGNRVTYGSRAGSEPVLCEGIPFTLQFTKARGLRCFPLDESGNRRAEIRTEGNIVHLSPEYQTLWYEIEVF